MFAYDFPIIWLPDPQGQTWSATNAARTAEVGRRWGADAAAREHGNSMLARLARARAVQVKSKWCI